MKSIKKSVAVITVVAAVLGMSVFAFGAASSKNSKDKDVIKSGVRIRKYRRKRFDRRRSKY